MPSPGALRHLTQLRHRPHTVEQCDHELERLADLARIVKRRHRHTIMRRLDIWLDERLRAMRGGELNHPEDRAHQPEWGPLG